MKLKQIALTTSLLFSCHIAVGATYVVQDEPQLNLSDQFDMTGNLLNKSEDSTAQARQEQLTQEYLEVVKLLKNKQLKAADEKIDRLIQQNPRESNFYNLRALSKVLSKEYTPAIQSYQKAIELAPKNIKSRLGLATVFLLAEDYTQAKQAANGALSINSKSAHAYLILAEVAYKENRLQDVESSLLTAQKEIWGLKKQEIIIANNLVKFYVRQKQPQKALSVAQDIIKRYPDDSSALSLLARTQIYNKKTEQAIPTLEKLINQESKDSRHRILLAKLLLNQPGKKPQILKLLTEVSSIAPDNAQVQVQKTIILTQLKDFPEALRTTKKVKQLAPDTGMAEALEGDIYLAERQMALALTAFQKSYQIKPNNKTLGVIIKIMISQGKQSESIDFLNRELNKNPKNFTAHFLIGNIYQQQNNNREAEKHYQAILTEQPDNVLILNNMAWIYHLDNNPKALALAERAYQKAPKSAAIADTYAVILVKRGDLAKSLKIFEKAGKLAPQNYDIQYHMADAYALNGQTKQAIKILKTITGSEQKFSEKEAAIALLNKLE